MELDDKRTMNLLTKWLLVSRITLYCGAVCGAFFYASAAFAEVRVLIKFDGTDHRLHRLVNLEPVNPALVAEQASQHSMEQNPGKVGVLWMAADGSVLHTNSIDDPRLTHAPHSGAVSPSVVGLSDGAYMVSGPAGSAVLEIRLPANDALALQAQTWQFDLNL